MRPDPAPDPVPRPLDHLALRGARDALAVEGRGLRLTHGALDRRVGALAAWLRARGLGQGDRVASWLPKSEAAMLLPLAAARAGLVHGRSLSLLDKTYQKIQISSIKSY